ncbi:MAG TPA: lipase maturation factor family protein, partial [Verrucomicrobiae bacterium]|nr:lipase maturation factor family protein [Verrucomicrobiae bacterium]
VAFGSLWLQVSGLIGKDGIMPATDLMSQARRFVDAEAMGLGRFHLLPTLCWFGAPDWFLRLQCGAGCGLALLLMAGVAQPLCLGLLWVLYLSLTSVGSDFLAFQWDNLLLETGFLAIFLAPCQWLPQPSRERAPPGTAIWLLRVLLFKLMFLSGVVKLTSEDSSWRNLSALSYHYQTQPLPTWIAWYAAQLPLWFQKASCALMLLIELVVPFLIFLPRRVRLFGAAALALLQILILLTGNYTYFNWLTLALCLLLCDDFFLGRFWPWKRSSPVQDKTAPPSAWGLANRAMRALVAFVFIGLALIQISVALGQDPSWLRPARALERWLGPFRTVNSYGLFAVMTTERPEIIVEGSVDGQVWNEYQFPYKPGDLTRRPRFVAPFQPRLDWQMWFAALGTYRQNPWFLDFCVRLLQNSPDVVKLLQVNPFPASPPRYVRAQRYEYRFTTLEERARTGAWWKRSYRGIYLPPVSLEMLQKAQRLPKP